MMYQFNIKKQDDGMYRFELQGIKLIVNGFTIKDDQYYLIDPTKAIAFFNIDESIYGISNDPLHFNTAESFFDSMKQQYMIFVNGVGKLQDNAANINAQVNNSTVYTA